MAKWKDYYKILGIKPMATADEIKSAYRKKAKEVHPDLNKDNPHAEEKFKEVQEAYRILHDEDSRAEYDREYVIHFPQKPTQKRTKQKQKGSRPMRVKVTTNNEWIDTLLAYQEEVTYLIKMKFIIEILAKDSMIGVVDHSIAIDLWQNQAQQYYEKLKVSKMMVGVFGISTAPIAAAMTRLKQAMEEEKVSVQQEDNYVKNQYKM